MTAGTTRWGAAAARPAALPLLPARRGRRPQQGRLRGAAARRAQGHLRGVHGPRAALLRGAGLAVERMMTDNGPGYRSGEFNELLEATGGRHIYTRPFSPWQNGKVERLNRTIAQEWQYARAWDGEAERADALPAFMEHYNWSRPHSACGCLPPMSRIVGVNNLLARNTWWTRCPNHNIEMAWYLPHCPKGEVSSSTKRQFAISLGSVTKRDGILSRFAHFD